MATLVQQLKDSYLEDTKKQFDALLLENYNASTYAVLSPANNQYTAVRSNAHLFALQFQEETEFTLSTLFEVKSFLNHLSKHNIASNACKVSMKEGS